MWCGIVKLALAIRYLSTPNLRGCGGEVAFAVQLTSQDRLRGECDVQQFSDLRLMCVTLVTCAYVDSWARLAKLLHI